MKTQFLNAVGVCWVAILTGAAVFSAGAQTNPGLEIQTYAGLTITGAVGSVYSIEYISDLSYKDDPAAWHCLEYLQLPASPFLWTDKSAPARGKRFYRATVMEAPTNTVFIPPGTFRMGSPDSEIDRQPRWETPLTAVIISRGFWMGKYEVTQAEYQGITGSNPSWCNGVQREGTEEEINYGTDLNRPVERVSPYDANAYCEALTERERAAGRIPANCVYRLPTEAEWEYACRAWTSTRFSYGDDPGYTNLTQYAWYSDNAGGRTHPVGQKLPNPWGLYDMHGNVFELCRDWIGELPGGTLLDPQRSDSDFAATNRGGDWSLAAATYRSSFRDILNGWVSAGFRVVLAPGPR